MNSKGEKKRPRTEWVDPDDAPELDDEFFNRAEIIIDGKVVQRGKGINQVTTEYLTRLGTKKPSS